MMAGMTCQMFAGYFVDIYWFGIQLSIWLEEHHGTRVWQSNDAMLKGSLK